MEEKERLLKASQTIGFLTGDLREIVAKTDSTALEELVIPMLEKIVKIRRVLNRLAEEN